MYIFKGVGVVWDLDNQKPLCKFKNGEYATDNKSIAKKLLSYGYETESTIEEEPEPIKEEAKEVKKETPKKNPTRRKTTKKK